MKQEVRYWIIELLFGNRDHSGDDNLDDLFCRIKMNVQL